MGDKVNWWCNSLTVFIGPELNIPVVQENKNMITENFFKLPNFKCTGDSDNYFKEMEKQMDSMSLGT